MSTQDQSKARKLVIAAAASSVIGLATLGAAHYQITQATETTGSERIVERQHAAPFQRMRAHMAQRRIGGGPRGSTGKHIEGRLAFLKTELHITEAQLKVWEKFAGTLRVMTEDAAAKREGMKTQRENHIERSGQTLMQRFERSEERLEAAVERQKKLKAVVEPLYAMLSDDQKKWLMNCCVSDEAGGDNWRRRRAYHFSINGRAPSHALI